MLFLLSIADDGTADWTVAIDGFRSPRNRCTTSLRAECRAIDIKTYTRSAGCTARSFTCDREFNTTAKEGQRNPRKPDVRSQ
jgi:hypothetical protein